MDDRACAVAHPSYRGEICHCSLMPTVEFVQGDLAAERISMQAENLRGVALITFGLLQSQLYEFLFELSDCFFEINSSSQSSRLTNWSSFSRTNPPSSAVLSTTAQSRAYPD